MLRRISIALVIAFFSSLLVMTISTSISAESPLPIPPLSWPKVPAEGPLTPEQINDLPPPSEDTSALDEQLKVEIARIEADTKAKGLHLASLPVEKIEAGVAFRESLTEAQRQGYR